MATTGGGSGFPRAEYAIFDMDGLLSELQRFTGTDT